MRILHLTDRLGARGGAHRHLLGVLAWLVERGFDVHVAAGRDDGAPVPCPTSIVAGLDARLAQAVDLEALVKRLQPDLVHVHTVVNPLVLEWAQGRPAVITVQDHRYFCPGRGKWTRDGAICTRVMEAAACARCFEEPAYSQEVLELTQRRLRALAGLAVIVLSRFMASELVSAGVPAGRIHVIPPFVHGLDMTADPDGPPCVLIVGRLAEHKGVMDAIAAWRLSGVGLPFVAAGTGALREEVVRAGGEVLGWLHPLQLSRAYRRARAVIFSPRWQEPFGIAGLEALTMGVPVAAWRSGAVAEWHTDSRRLAMWGDVDGLALALREADVRSVLAPSGFDRDLLMARLVAIYEDIAGS